MQDVSAGTQIACPVQATRSSQLSGASTTPTATHAGDRYEIRDLIAKGGMGAVYRAWDNVLCRDVAVKLLLEDAPTADIRKRFDYEATITAQLQHPNIPPIYDLGTLPASALEKRTSEDGDSGNRTEPLYGLRSLTEKESPPRPFLAMKLIQGRTLAQLLKREGKGGARWVATFEAICQAVGYAHEAGIIHRDLKPLNVMVGAFGEVQVMDWGLAKRLAKGDSTPSKQVKSTVVVQTLQASITPSGTMVQVESSVDSDGETEMTQAGTIMGTPAYMAPEQARGEIEAVDERADVFALGAILCELLTGQTPLSGQTTQLLTDCAAGKFDSAYQRLDDSNEDPALIHLAKQCLAYDAANRPRTARDVAIAVAKYRADSEAWARELQVQQAQAEIQYTENAKRANLKYRGACALGGVLVAGIFASGVFAWHAVSAKHEAVSNLALAVTAQNETAVQLELTQKAESRARQEETNAKTAADAEKTANALTQKRFAQLQKTYQIVVSMFTDLDVTELKHNRIPLEMAFGNRLAQICSEINGESVGGPLEVAKLQFQLGSSLIGLDKSAEAIAMLEQAAKTREALLGPNHIDTLNTIQRLSDANLIGNRIPTAIELLKTNEARLVASVGTDTPEYQTNQLALASAYRNNAQHEKALPILEAQFKRFLETSGGADENTLVCLFNITGCHLALGDINSAEPLAKKCLQLNLELAGPDHPSTLHAQARYAECFTQSDRFEEALPILVENVRRTKSVLGPEHTITLDRTENLSKCYSRLGNHGEAIATRVEVASVFTRIFGADHPQSIRANNNLAMAYSDAELFDKALEIQTDALTRCKSLYGPTHANSLLCQSNLAQTYIHNHQYAIALPMLTEVVEQYRLSLGSHRDETIHGRLNLAVLHQKMGHADTARELTRQAIDGIVDQPGVDRLMAIGRLTLECQRSLGATSLVKALLISREAIKLMRVEDGEQLPNSIVWVQKTAIALCEAGDEVNGTDLLRLLLPMMIAKSGPDHQNVLSAESFLGSAFYKSGRIAEAIPFFEKLAVRHALTLGLNDPNSLSSRNNVAVCYRRVGRATEARKIFEEVLPKLGDVNGENHPHTIRTAEHLANAYLDLDQTRLAESTFDRVFQAHRRQLPGNATTLADLMDEASTRFLDANAPKIALKYLDESVRLRALKKAPGFAERKTATLVGEAYVMLGRHADAVSRLTPAVDVLLDQKTPLLLAERNAFRRAAVALATAYDATNREAQAAELRAKLPREVAPRPKVCPN